MTSKLLLSFAVAAALCAEAHADVVTDRVLLVTGSGGCTNATSFHRIEQRPDGSQTAQSTEYQVPYGSYLEITSIEYTTPFWTSWATSYAQSLDLTIRQRSGSAMTVAFTARYQNQATYAEDSDGTYKDLGEATSPGAQTHVAAFPVGPLVGSAGRLCVAVTSNNFWVFGGSVRVRGHLIPSGEPPIVVGTTTSL